MDPAFEGLASDWDVRVDLVRYQAPANASFPAPQVLRLEGWQLTQPEPPGDPRLSYTPGPDAPRDLAGTLWPAQVDFPVQLPS